MGAPKEDSTARVDGLVKAIAEQTAAFNALNEFIGELASGYKEMQITLTALKVSSETLEKRVAPELWDSNGQSRICTLRCNYETIKGEVFDKGNRSRIQPLQDDIHAMKDNWRWAIGIAMGGIAIAIHPIFTKIAVWISNIVKSSS